MSEDSVCRPTGLAHAIRELLLNGLTKAGLKKTARCLKREHEKDELAVISFCNAVADSLKNYEVALRELDRVEPHNGLEDVSSPIGSGSMQVENMDKLDNFEDEPRHKSSGKKRKKTKNKEQSSVVCVGEHEAEVRRGQGHTEEKIDETHAAAHTDVMDIAENRVAANDVACDDGKGKKKKKKRSKKSVEVAHREKLPESPPGPSSKIVDDNGSNAVNGIAVQSRLEDEGADDGSDDEPIRRGLGAAPKTNARASEAGSGAFRTPGKETQATVSGDEEENGTDAFHSERKPAKKDVQLKARRLSEGALPFAHPTPFKRVKVDEVTYRDSRLRDNRFETKNDTYGVKAHNDLVVTRGKGFRKEKTKKKRQNHHGGTISYAVNSIKFEDSD